MPRAANAWAGRMPRPPTPGLAGCRPVVTAGGAKRSPGTVERSERRPEAGCGLQGGAVPRRADEMCLPEWNPCLPETKSSMPSVQ